MDARRRPASRRAIIALGTGVAVGAALALRPRDDGGTDAEPADGRGPAATAAPRPVEERGLAGARAAGPATSALPSAPPSAAAPAAEGPRARAFRVRGRVTGVASLPGDAWALVAAMGQALTYVARVPIAADGTFVADAEAPTDGARFLVRVSADVLGLVVPDQTAEAKAGDTLDVELAASTEEGTLRGRVVDPTGRPLANLTFRVVRSDGSPLRHGELPRRDVGAVAGPVDHDLAARVTTDADGRFRVDRLSADAYVFVALDDRTMLEVEHGTWVVPREDEIVVTARAAYVVRVEAVLGDDVAASAWEGATYVLSTSDGGADSIGTAARRTVFRGALADGGDGARDLRLTVVAPGFQPEERALRVDRATPELAVELRLRRTDAAAFGALVVTSTLRTPEGRPLAPALLEWTAVGRSRNGRWVKDAPRADGRTAFPLVEGARALELRAPPSVRFGDLLTWEGAVTVVRGEDHPLRFPAVPTGALRVRLPPDDGSGWVSASVRRGPTTSVWTGTCATRELVVPTLPVGSWRLSVAVRAPGGRSTELVADAEVVEGAETEVEPRPAR